jgi:ligand-binding sensor domain-containing protein
MTSSTINAICQDSHGFMWFGTDIGLSKYDGYDITNFKDDFYNTGSLGNCLVYDILEDTIPGNLWVATMDGLYYYDCSRNEFFQFCLDSIDNEGGIYPSINTLFWDLEHNLWLGTTNGVVCINNQHKASVIFKLERNESSNLFYINDIEYWKNDLYFISTSYGLYTFNINDYSYNRTIKAEILSSLKDSKRNFWFGTRSEGFWYLPANTDSDYKQFTPENSQLKSGFITSIAEDRLGQIWISERENGISIFNPINNQWLFLSNSIYNKNGIKSNVNKKIYVDRQKNVWIGSHDAGIYFLDNNKKAFRLYQFNYLKNGLKNNKIRSMYQDSDGDIWIGSKVDGCLSKFDRNKGPFEHFEYDADNPTSLNDDINSASKKLIESIVASFN